MKTDKVNKWKYLVKPSVNSEHRNRYSVILRKNNSLHCNCLGFKYYGYCRHVKEVQRMEEL